MLSKYNVITLFPNLFDEWMKTGIISNGLDKNILEFQTTNLRVDLARGQYLDSEKVKSQIEDILKDSILDSIDEI